MKSRLKNAFKGQLRDFLQEKQLELQKALAASKLTRLTDSSFETSKAQPKPKTFPSNILARLVIGLPHLKHL